jgi:hypothetical protein
MAKYSKEKDRNVNEEGNFEDESVYEKKNKEEREKIPVEYLGYVKKRRSSNVIHVTLIWIVSVVLVAFGPGTQGKEICPECGRTRTYDTLAWGKWELRGLNYSDTDWTRWFEEQNPMVHNHRFILFGKEKAALFGYVPLPFTMGENWNMPGNLIARMNEIKPMFRPAKILDIPRVLAHVASGKEWEAIMVPLCMGTPQEAFDYWQQHLNVLMAWSQTPLTEPLPESYVADSESYIALKTPIEEKIPGM